MQWRSKRDDRAGFTRCRTICQARGVPCATANVFGEGGDGAVKLAETVLVALPKESKPLPMLYDAAEPVEKKLHAIATQVYGADGVQLTDEAKAKLALFARSGFDKLPLCMAKTQDSLSDDAKKRGRPRGFTITVRLDRTQFAKGRLDSLSSAEMIFVALPRLDDEGLAWIREIVTSLRRPVIAIVDGDPSQRSILRRSAQDAGACDCLVRRELSPAVAADMAAAAALDSRGIAAAKAEVTDDVTQQLVSDFAVFGAMLVPCDGALRGKSATYRINEAWRESLIEAGRINGALPVEAPGEAAEAA